MAKWIPAVQSLRPVLDMYLDSSVAVVGCHSGDLARSSCELDILVVSRDARPSTSVKLGGTYMDLIFATEKEVMKPRDPENAVALASARPVRDASMVLSTATSAAAALLSDSCKKSGRRRLASSLKSLGRAREAAGKGAGTEADFWLLAASYDFAAATLYSKEAMPSPSHLFSQMKEASSASAEAFEAFFRGAGLLNASRAGCTSRLDGIGVLRDLMAHRRPSQDSVQSPADESLQITRGKVTELGTRMEHAECFSFLGLELVRSLLSIPSTERGRKRRGAGLGPDVGSLVSGEGRLLGEMVEKDLGLTRDKDTVQSAASLLEKQISALAKAV